MPKDALTAESPQMPDIAPGNPPGKAYAWYALAVLVLVYALNFIDRQMLTILAPDIKHDLGISDAQFGFLYGTAFGVFYSVFGIPLGKLADRWSRKRLLAIGLATWSTMTALSGLAGNFTQIGMARIGVGVGEATAGPCGFSLLSDLFPPRRRATVIAIFTAGIYIGGGMALSLGTSLAHGWDHAFAAGARPLGLAGWQAAFLGLGLPGLVMALWVASLREPARGRFEAVTVAPDMPAAQAWRAFAHDLATIAPPFTLWAAARRGPAKLRSNVLSLLAIMLVAAGLTRVLGDPAQWFVLGTGVYAVVSWAQSMRHDDPDGFALIWKNPALVGVNVGYGLLCALAYSASAFGPLYAMQTFHAPPAQVALIVGGGGAAGGALGTIAGGWLGDWLSGGVHHARRVLVIMGAIALATIPQAVMMSTHALTVFYWGVFPLWFLLSAGLGSSAGTVVNVVPPRLRATASASFFLGATMLGLSLGPYAAGRISQSTHSLWAGLVAVTCVIPFALVSLAFAWRHLARKEAEIS
ncbi:MFS transporter [Novosphingobium sp.]|uniref:MFS transporter n=1 Tax=Novosphingobium sp. TaxID=1874826 RepID=UPI00333F9077